MVTVFDTIASFRAALDDVRRGDGRVGLVPTMGYLHEGHASLIERAARECDVVAVTIFVNPTQFGAGEDFERYPRDFDRDLAIVAAAGGLLVFAPGVDEIYPDGAGGGLTTVTVAEVSDGLEGASRPTHFAGVATVVTKLFNIAGPCAAYFGEKDWQQVQVVRQLVRDSTWWSTSCRARPCARRTGSRCPRATATSTTKSGNRLVPYRRRYWPGCTPQVRA